MDANQRSYEAPRHRMVTARISPAVELARWMFERQGVPYAEQPHAPMLHAIFTLAAGGGVEIPVVTCAEGVWKGGPPTVAELAGKSPPDARIFSGDPAVAADEHQVVAFLFGHLLKQVRRLVYHRLLPYKAVIAPCVVEGTPLWERAFVYGLYGIWRRMMAAGLDFSPALIAQAPIDIEAAFVEVERRLADGRQFLGGEAPGSLDIVFSALTGPVIFPDEYCARLPKLAELPPDFRSYVEYMRERRGGRLVLEVYSQARGLPQPRLPLGKTSAPAPSARVLRFGANLLRRVSPNLSFASVRFVATWDGVREALANDVELRIGPVNAQRIEEVSGAFILGLDRSERELRERKALFAAFAAVDMARARAIIASESQGLLDAAAAGLGRIDVVNGYARLVAARSAVALFGIHGPSEPDLLRVTRAVFAHTFLNISNDATIRETAIAAGVELAAWIDADIARRRADGSAGPADLLGELMVQAPQSGFTDDDIRRNLAGMLVGAIDTTATAVANIVAEIGNDPSVARNMAADVGDPERLAGWCWELLRRHPHNPLLLRKTAVDTAIAGKAVAADTTIVALTLAAMNDPAAFPDPDRVDPGRPPDRYLHLGAGLHQCAGRAVNAFQIPMMVGALMQRRPTRFGALRMRGAFPDRLVVGIVPVVSAGIDPAGVDPVRVDPAWGVR